MTIVFACPKCNYTMKAPDEKGGAKVKCLKCGLPLEVPYARGKLIDVWAEPKPGSHPGTDKLPGSNPGTVKLPGSNPGTIKPTSKSNPAAPKPSMALPPRSKAEDLLEQAARCKDNGEMESAIQLLRQAHDQLRMDNRAFPVETYLLLPFYLQQAGRKQEAWEALKHFLFRGYPHQTNDRTLLAKDRAKILDKMRIFLESDNHPEKAEVYEAFSMVFKGIGLYRDNRTRELKVWFDKEHCTEYLHGLKRYKGNLGRAQELHTILVEEIGQYPDLDFERMGQRVEEALARS
jgi:hypothetical protein